MDLRQLRYFLAVADELNIGRAAERLHIVQPALSRQIQALEAELGVRLLDRLPRGVRLTAAGERLATDAQRLLIDLEDTSDRVRRTGQGKLGALNIGFVDTMSWGGLIPATLQVLQRDHAGIALRLVDMSSLDQLAAIRDGRLDAGFAFYRDPGDRTLDGMTVIDDRITLAVSKGSTLASRSSVRLRDLEDLPFISFPRQAAPRFFDDLRKAFDRHGFQPDVAHEGMTTISILGLVGAGLGVAFQPQSTEHRKPDSVTLLPVDDLDLAVRTELVWRADSTSQTMAILKTIVTRCLAKKSPAQKQS
ncbi:MAG: LysR family transcriptional regulator [Pseudomonadota bacterium]